MNFELIFLLLILFSQAIVILRKLGVCTNEYNGTTSWLVLSSNKCLKLAQATTKAPKQIMIEKHDEAQNLLGHYHHLPYATSPDLTTRPGPEENQ